MQKERRRILDDLADFTRTVGWLVVGLAIIYFAVVFGVSLVKLYLF